MDKPEYHQYKLMLFQFCGEAFRRQIMCNEKFSGNYRTTRGSGVHKGREVNLSQKKDTGTDLPISDITDAARDVVVAKFGDDLILEDEYSGLSYSAVRDMAIDSTIRMVRKDFSFWQQAVQPLEVELPIRVELPAWPFNLAGKLDLIEIQRYNNGIAVRDSKTSNRTPPADIATTSEQLTLYDMLCRAKFERAPYELSYDYLIEMKHSIKTVRYPVQPNIENQKALLARVAVMHDCIEKGSFAPCTPSFWKCSPEWCLCFPTCKYAMGRKGL